MTRKIPHGDEGLICPLHQADCSTVCHKCPWWTQVRGKHPQTGEDVDDWRCAIAWMPMLAIETAKNVRGAQAATESMRNEVVKRMDRPVERVQAPTVRLIDG